MSPAGCLLLPRGYVHEYDHNIQTSSLKRLANQSQTLCGTVLGGGMKVCINGQGLTKIAATAINSKYLQKSSSPEPESL